MFLLGPWGPDHPKPTKAAKVVMPRVSLAFPLEMCWIFLVAQPFLEDGLPLIVSS